MTLDDLIDTLLQRWQVEWSLESDGGRKIVGREPRHQLIEEPKSLLGEGERQVVVPWNRQDGWGQQTLPGLPGGLDAFGQACHGWDLEQTAQRNFHLEGFAHAGHELGCQQRMAAEGEEVVVDANQFDVEELGPDLRQ